MPRKRPTEPTTKSHMGRDPATVRNVMLRMSNDYVDELDELCRVNHRSRREIVEYLVREAALELRSDVNARVNPY